MSDVNRVMSDAGSSALKRPSFLPTIEPLAEPRNKDEWAQHFLADVLQELRSAQEKFAPMNSHHEGYAVILEELDEYWTDVKDKHVASESVQIAKELIQVAAMACRAYVDCVVGPSIRRER